MSFVEEVCSCARHTEDLMKAAFRIDITKVLDPTDPDDFIIITSRLSRALAKIARPAQGEALREALNTLDVDWAAMTPAGRTKIINAAKASITSVPPQIIPPITNTLEVRGSAVVRRTKKAVVSEVGITLGANINVSMALRDERIVNHIASSQGHFVTTEYDRRAEHFSAKARGIVASGLDEGLGQDEIARMLRAEMGNALGPRRSKSYWNVIANAFVNRARSYGQLASYSEAGIERYRFEAILDEVTTEQCRMLHGKEWNVQKGLQQHVDVAESSDPQGVKDIMPWFRTGRDDDGNQIIYTQDQAGNRTTMAEVITPSVGQRDVVGQYKTTQALNEISAVQPPIHALCRSTIVANI